MKKIFYINIIFFIFSICGYLTAQTTPPEKLWDRAFQSIGDDYLKSILNTDDGNLLLGGYSNTSDVAYFNVFSRNNSYDYWIIKMDEAGNMLWNKMYGGGGNEFFTTMIQTYDNGFLLGGHSESDVGFEKNENSRGVFDYWIIKIDSEGNKQWDKTFGGAGQENLKSIIQTSDGGYLLGGSSYSDISGDKTSDSRNGTFDYWLVKINANGDKEWDKTYGSEANDRLESIVMTEDGNYLLGGFTAATQDNDTISDFGGDIWMIKIDSLGTEIWEKYIGSSQQDYLTSIIPTFDGNYLLGGWSYSDIGRDKDSENKGLTDFWVIKLDVNGNIIWDKSYGGAQEDEIIHMYPLNDGGFLLSGCSLSNSSFDKSQDSRGELDYWVVRIDANGNKLWDKTLGSHGWDMLGATVTTSGNNVLVGGSSYSDRSIDKTEDNYGSNDFWIVNLGVEQLDSNNISGKIFEDLNGNCIKDEGEIPLVGWKVEAKSDFRTYYAVSDSNGVYQLNTTIGDYIVSYYPPNITEETLISSPSCSIIPHSVQFNEYGAKFFDVDVPIKRVDCAVLNIDVSTNRRLRCFKGQTFISYRNAGIATAENVRIEVEIPEFTIPISSSVPWTSFDESSRLMTFDVGNLDAGEHRRITITDSIACVNEAFNKTECTKAIIYPKNSCLPDNNDWNKADLQVEGLCLVLFDPLVIFTITNAGIGDMDEPQQYRIFADNSLIYENKVQLEAGDSLKIEVPTGGKSMRLEVDQVTYHPYNSQVSVNVEGCGTSDGQVSNGFINQFPQNDENLEFEITCQRILGSFDPNDKLVSPEGFTDNHYVKPNTRLEYTIRFQNTGTFQAFNVILVDTLTNFLDMTTFEMLSASHDYLMNIKTTNSRQHILTWTFPNINLPDSTTNEPESHGYIKFKISPKADLAEGTQVENFADIFFDFNDPIRTNTTLTTFENYVFPTPDTPVDPCTFVSVAKVGDEISICETEAMIQAGTPSAGNGFWTLIQGAGSIASPESSESSVTGLSIGENIFRWQISTDICADNYQDLTITVNATPEKSTVENPEANILQSSIAGDSYHWYLDGELMPGQTSRSFEATESGGYQVQVLSNGCISVLSDVLPLEITSLEATLTEVYGFKIHPNPTDKDLQISFKRLPEQNIEFTLRTPNGAIIQKVNSKGLLNQSWESTFDLESLPKGVYLLEIITEKGGFIKKIVKQ